MGRMSDLHIEMLENMTDEERQEYEQKQAEAAPTPGPATSTPQQTPKKPDPRAEQWAKENEWF